jgi:hypothetical protein
MHIALVHGSVVPPQKYGGTERVVAWLARGLLQLGHSVSLVLPAPSFIRGANRVDQIPSNADIVHFMATPAQLPKQPFLITIHGNGKPGEVFHSNTVFLSKRHAENHGSRRFVYNGIDLQDTKLDPQREPYLVYLAKASLKVKNLRGAIELARLIDLPLWVIGSRSLPLNLQRWFPSVGGVKYLGMMNDDEKQTVLKKATALLFPVRWEEPFGLAVTEALASGCAVFGTPYGSLPELVSSDVGALSANPDELSRIFRDFCFVPEVCRKHVEQNFTHIQMAQSYLRLYEEVIEKGLLCTIDDAPRTRPEWNAQDLLPWGTLS